ncbi:MAG: biopolymer transporter ExbD [Candidatus Omnitrophica bacterium]|nr:biopolymer transporter ExbD [Candidatus Omnitrophota bacterium]MBU0881133.1 biopolymer transporter ExbD [Candidatus Omnitrophota bacterium]MBU0895793.1 biopolymer transporter ExbD [Candidatus Omnitrophota bacterium]MBU1808615.1 biopolymer transporter ExbD [Candidatus Omnitrophota bacterium]
MKFKRRVKIEKGMVDLTPLVNVFFLLFIFFLFTSSFIFQPGIKVNLPKALTSEVIQQEGVVITITGNDKVYLNEREITADEIASNLRLLAKTGTPLLIKADSKASLGRVVEIWDMCRNEGVLQVNIATGK